MLFTTYLKQHRQVFAGDELHHKVCCVWLLILVHQLHHVGAAAQPLHERRFPGDALEGA